MKFVQYIKKDRYFALRLYCDEQNIGGNWDKEGDNNVGNSNNNLIHGYRAEAPHPRLELHNSEVLFDYIPQKPMHPDLLALLCIVVYYPFFQKWTETQFPLKISSNLAKALSELPLYTWDGARNCYCRMEGGGINVSTTNIDPELTSYKGGGQTLLSFGGGLDSTAVKCLFPGAHIVHEKEWRFHRKNHNIAEPRTIAVEELITTLDKRPGSSKHSLVIASNNRNLTKPSGWTGWISCIATSLLVANDLEASNILLGSSLASLLGGGKRFIGVEGKAFPGTHIWSELLWKSGVNLFCPVAGLSELSLLRIIKNTSRTYLDKCAWCFRKNGYPCHSCFKCFRRDLLVYSEADGGHRTTNPTTHVQNFSNSPDFPWERYRKAKFPAPDRIGPTMNYLLHRYMQMEQRSLPSWLSASLTFEKESFEKESFEKESFEKDSFEKESFEKEWSWLGAWYLPSLCLVPEHLKTYIYKRIAQKVRPMTDSEKARLESYGS